ncbi:phospholipase D-like domain-containing protein [Cupriavidus sp. CV2]|uniref:phospholipase D-like domain-containing protein n=1 Tax=Cupriavidus ulmosensis TaxID=3065913 RepID=UPI00296AA752|nr:phospholipase D-like domain-containing protein [Cupriavidus sp. CV2]MDW3687202.1 phospholipase D-like domain-containing protein [Cupriavidus sp. CV2]
MPVKVRGYLSPTLVLLAFDWPEGKDRDDFLGFAVKRTPGFWSAEGTTREAASWLPNRNTFHGPVPAGQPDVPSKDAPIQKFMWWDNRIESGKQEDRAGTFSYVVYPVVGTPAAPMLLDGRSAICELKLPAHVEDGVGTWFNRAVMRSQAFSRKVLAMGLAPNQPPPPDKDLELRTWLANGMERAIPSVLDGATVAVGAAYHLTDKLWIIPQLRQFSSDHGHEATLVYDAHPVKQGNAPAKPTPNADAVRELGHDVEFCPRDKTNIMHDKILVTNTGASKPARVLMGSANFTTEGLTQQANLLHTFASEELAALYNERLAAMASNPGLAATASLTQDWSPSIQVGSVTKVRAIFSPEPTGRQVQTETIIAAIGAAQHSVLFCMFSPTDEPLINACFRKGDEGKMMFGLVNRLSRNTGTIHLKANASGKPVTQAQLAAIELYHRSKAKRDVVDGMYFTKDAVPDGYEPELPVYPGEQPPPYPPVVIHHKFIIIDAEGADPIVYTGSANMSENSLHHNDENLLEIRSPKIAATYLAEFMRLYEHFRARAIAIEVGKDPARKLDLTLAPDARWARKYYVEGSPECKARKAMAQ